MATLLRTDGTSVEFTGTGKAGKNGKRKVTLDDAYRAIGCDNVECYPVANRQVLILDGEGKFNSVPNRAATLLWVEKYGFTDVMYGNVLVTQGEGWR